LSVVIRGVTGSVQRNQKTRFLSSGLKQELGISFGLVKRCLGKMLGVKAKLYTLQEANKVGEFRLDYWIPKEKSEVLILERTAGSPL